MRWQTVAINPHPHAKAGHLNAEALLGMYPMLEAWRQRF
jgi:hypothetical protein